MKTNLKKIIEGIGYVAKELGQTSLHEVSKAFYFADQKHLVSFGFPIFGDNYIAMKFGPVPSMTYDLLKALAEKSPFHIGSYDFSGDG